MGNLEFAQPGFLYLLFLVPVMYSLLRRRAPREQAEELLSSME